MSVWTLRRLVNSPHGVFGVLCDPAGLPYGVTLERPYDPARATVEGSGSCIPAGFYPCEPVLSPKFGATMGLRGVPGRSHILFHAGNRTEDTEGCILLARAFGQLDGRPAIVESQAALQGWLARLDRDEVLSLSLNIVWCNHGVLSPD